MPYTPANGQNFPGQQWAFAGMTTLFFLAICQHEMVCTPNLRSRLRRKKLPHATFDTSNSSTRIGKSLIRTPVA